jgi:hypothetical protein
LDARFHLPVGTKPEMDHNAGGLAVPKVNADHVRFSHHTCLKEYFKGFNFQSF